MSTCKGIFLKVEKTYKAIKHQRIEESLRLSYVQDISCPGCIECDWFWKEADQNRDLLTGEDFREEDIVTPSVEFYPNEGNIVWFDVVTSGS